MSEQDLTPEEQGRLGPYGLRALSYVRDHCPGRFATIPDPIGFFTALGDQMHEEVLAVEESLRAAPTAGEDWAKAVGEMQMAHLMAEERVFSEMLYQAWPPEDESGDLEADPEDAEYLRYLAFLQGVQEMNREIAEAMDQAQDEDR